MALPKTCSAVAVFQRSSKQLLDAISEPIPLAWRLYGKGIISDETLQDVQVVGQPDYRIIATILEAVRKAVKAKEELLIEFLDAMDQQFLADRVVAKMRSELNHESPFESYCKTCNQLVCERCTIQLHRGHDHIPITDSLVTEQKQQIIDSLKPVKDHLSATLLVLKTRADEITSKGREVEAQIDATAEQAWEALQESKKRLKSEVSSLVHHKLQELSKQKEEVENNQTQLKSDLEDVEEKIRVGSSQQILAELMELASKVSSHRSSVQLLPVEEVDIKFEASNDLLSQCSKLGEVKKRVRLLLLPPPSPPPPPPPPAPSDPWTGLTDPWGVAITTSGEVVVSEKTDRPIMFNREGRKIRSFGHPEGQLKQPRDVAVTSDNHVLVTDRDSQIHAFNLDRTFLATVGQTGKEPLQFSQPNGIATHPHGFVYVADTCNHRIQVLSSNLQKSHMYMLEP